MTFLIWVLLPAPYIEDISWNIASNIGLPLLPGLAPVSLGYGVFSSGYYISRIIAYGGLPKPPNLELIIGTLSIGVLYLAGAYIIATKIEERYKVQ